MSIEHFRTIVVAEIGSNHLGSLGKALHTVTAAARCGVDAVKFQLFRADTLDSRPDVREELRPLEVELRWLPVLARRANREGLLFIISVFDIDLIPQCEGLVDMVKIASGDLTYLSLIRSACKLKVPLILSTGMANSAEIAQAVGVALDSGIQLRDIWLLHCVVNYPAAPSYYSRKTYLKLRDSYPYCRIGLSDHTRTNTVAVCAALDGAHMIERHFGLPPLDGSPDEVVSFTPDEMTRYVDAVRDARYIGNDPREEIGPLPCESDYFATIRRSDLKPLRG